MAKFSTPVLGSKFQPEGQLQVAVVVDNAGDFSSGRRSDGRVRETKVWGIKGVERIQANLHAQLFAQNGALHERKIPIQRARSVQDAARDVPVGVGGRRDKALRVEPQGRIGIGQSATADPVGPARRAIVDALVESDAKRPSGG